MKKSTAPDSSGISLKIFDVSNEELPTYTTDVATTYPTAIIVGHVEDFSDGGESRESKKYTPLNDRDYEEIISTGAISREPFSMTVLYDPEDATEGIAKLKIAFEENKSSGILIELNNVKTKQGTTYAAVIRVSKFSTTIEAGGKYKAELTLEKVGKPLMHEAA